MKIQLKVKRGPRRQKLTKKEIRWSGEVKESRSKDWGVKIANKASMVAKKKNLECNNINLKNFFVVLDNLTLCDRQ